MRIFTATMGTESNTFSPLPTSLHDFRDSVFYGPGEHPDDGPRPCTAQIPVGRRRAAENDFTFIEGSCFHASPGGPVNRQDYEFMRDRILEDLRAALPLDAVVMGLHGAMVAFGYDDVEGDLLSAIREIVGPDCLISAELDPHCHLTRKRLDACDIMVFYKEYPHTDCDDEAENLFDIVLDTLKGRVAPVKSVFTCHQVGSFPTTHPLMREFIDWVREEEKTPGILSISVSHSYPYADVPEMGAGVLVMSDGDKALGDAMAEKVGRAFMKLRGVTTPTFLSIDEGIDAALDAPEGPVAVTDASDNAGGGAAADNTSILRRLIERDVESAALGPLWDPMAVRTCFAAGLGAELDIRIGGKAGRTSNQPLDVRAKVTALAPEAWQSFGNATTLLGMAAAVRIGGIDVVLTSARTQALGTEMFTSLGIDPRARKILVLKSSNHFMAGYGPLLKGVIHVHSDGLLIRNDYTRVPYRRVARPLWPLDPDADGALIY
ncbi:M81 family metallopeptidase [Rhodobium gokarnense]|uniref:Microcystinase C n=1 Tax=Rhodobium gokarnense TaxID=364296 RepID=A0ABT3H920_9HYPH|nr:M81 family metallopeptidase [Rhodobium gokarnense]MCW2306879.1 microcystin degradation protein MlrC [Rhodobium gokarnense]